MTRFVIRPTVSADIDAIAAIYGDAVATGTASYELDPPDPAEMLRRWEALATSGYPHVVAEAVTGIAGFAYAGPYRPRPAYRSTVEDSVYVDRRHQGRGIGRALLAGVIERCEAQGFRQMIAVIGDGTRHEASTRLHAACGFRQVGVLQGSGFKQGRWLDTVLMQRALGAGSTTPPGDPLNSRGTASA